ncbi:hypothetical protein Patl1_22857 [Pistacia atlantica]|uniref:Uncharacterized protein n=1 Tax=Pistacia atlantica TaxID=434234 RepID=A0ACC1A185_9ROSI|nr:hypothetical protein Patl1_22857 [Pistacia atlantica]
MGEREAGSSSSLAGGGENQLESIVILINGDNPPGPLSENEKMWLESFVNGESFQNQQEVIRAKIERVPAMLREVKDNGDFYDPLVVSIGPYHSGNTRLELMERHKRTMALQFVDGDLKLLEELYQKVRCVAEAAKKCYTDQSSVAKFNKEEFSQMMFLDACFILRFIYCLAKGEQEALKMKSNMIALVKRDLFLLENQIPFQVVNKLSVKFGDETEKKAMLNNFFTNIRILPPQSYEKKFPCNLYFWKKEEQHAKEKPGTSDDEPAHLLDLVRADLFGKPVWSQKPTNWFSCRSVKELKEVGIHFRPSKTNKFADVAFQPGYLAKLELPPIYIDDSTKSMLLNMVAYESSPNCS